MTKKEGAAASSALFLWFARFASGNGISPCKTAPSPSFRRRGRAPRRGAIFPSVSAQKRMKPHAPSVPETAYFLFSREPPGEFERAAALSTFLRIPATCAPRRFPLPRGCAKGPQPFQLFFASRQPAHPAVPPPRGCAKGPQPLRLPSAGGGVYPAEERFPIRQRTKNGCSPMLHPSPKQLISFSAGNLRESLRGPQPSQLPSYPGDLRAPPSPLPGDARRGRSPFAFPSAGGDVYPAEERFPIRQRTKNG